MSFETDVVIIGAGVVGLAIARELAGQGRGVFVFERNSSFGQETSSRNSEVVHAGIHYPENSLKARFCLEGNRLLYELCERHAIPHRRTGKIIIAADDVEAEELERIMVRARKNGVDDLEILSAEQIQALEPNVAGRAGLLSPSTGIIDSHALMNFFYLSARAQGAEFLFESVVVGLDRAGDRWRVGVEDREGHTDVLARVVINSAGLGADKIARLAGIRREDYRIHYCKGEYFRLAPRWRGAVSRLIYPIPERAGLGIHLTMSLDGMLRLGPDARYVPEIGYRVDPSRRDTFYEKAGRLLYGLSVEDLRPDFAGIRPKLQGPEDPVRDFIVVPEEHPSLVGLVNLIGLESPGLTASPAIAKYIATAVASLLRT